jgi:hypothetical protein
MAVAQSATAHENECQVWHTEVKSKKPGTFLSQSKFSISAPRKIQIKFTSNEGSATRQQRSYS